jgi:hypothetical protein
MTRLRFSVIAAILFALVISPACYTLLKHPRVKENLVYVDVNDNRCNSCHYEDELWGYHHPQNHWYPTLGYGWGRYVPWWYTDYWYYDEANGPATIPLRSRGFRPAGDKGDPFRGIGPPVSSSGDSSPARATVGSDKGDSDAQQSKKRSVRPAKSKESQSKKKKKD